MLLFVKNLFISDTEISFPVPRMTRGWKSSSIKSGCESDDGKVTIIENAFYYAGTPPKPPEPPFLPEYWWTWDYTYATGTAPTIPSDNPYLYYWATSSSDINSGLWSGALDQTTASISYQSNITDDSGVTINDGDSIVSGTKIHFNFDTLTSGSNIDWYVNGGTMDTHHGVWLDGATYPSQVCTTAQKFTTKTYTDPVSNSVYPNTDVYIPLSVNKPENSVTFIDPNNGLTLYTIPQSSYPEWGAPPLPSNDYNSWSCESTSTCTAVGAGYKTLYMYYAPTYAYYYYGWQTPYDKTHGNVCRTNSIPLNKKISMLVNQTYDPNAYDGSTSPCVDGDLSCSSRVFIRPIDGVAVNCPTYYPYYNPDRNRCYSDYYWYSVSYHYDPDFGPDTLADYYYPFELKFRESRYGVNIIVSTSTSNTTPGSPSVSGPTQVVINEPNTYIASSTIAGGVAKKNSNSFLGSVWFALKQVFAQEAPVDQVVFNVDWDADGIVDYRTDPINYGDNIYLPPYTWTQTGWYFFRIQAVDTLSGNKSDWTTMSVSVNDPQSYTYPAPVISSSKICAGSLILSWDKVLRSPDNYPAEGYRLVKNGSEVFGNGSDINGSTPSITITDWSPIDTYSLYAYGPESNSGNTYIIPSPNSNEITPPTTQDGPLCTTDTNPTNQDVSIISGMKFFSKPSWADNTGHCKFSGSVDSTIKILEENIQKEYDGVVTKTCRIDNEPDFYAHSNGGSDTMTFSGKTEKIGKHSLICNIDYGPIVDGQSASSTTIGITSKCSKLPSVIEK